MQSSSTRVKRKKNTPENMGVGFSSLNYEMFEAHTKYRTTAVLFHNMNVINGNLSVNKNLGWFYFGTDLNNYYFSLFLFAILKQVLL